MKQRAEEFVNSKVSELNGLAPDKLTVIKWLTDFASDEVKAINYTRCSTKLKDKKKPNFKEWLEMYNYKKVKTLFVAHGKEYYYTEVYKQYQEWIKLHF